MNGVGVVNGKVRLCSYLLRYFLGVHYYGIDL